MKRHMLLEAVLKGEKESFPDLADSKFFEIFCVDRILQDFDLSHSEIRAGIVDGSMDGGIDAAYVFVNRNLLLAAEDFPFDSIKHDGVSIELFIVQVKNQPSFRETSIDKLVTSMPMLLQENSNDFKSEVENVFSLFKMARERLARKFPKVSAQIFYCSKGAAPCDSSITSKAKRLEEVLRSEIGEATKVKFTFLGAQDLYDMSRKQKRLVKNLPIGKFLLMEDSYVVLCTLTNYLKLITNDEGELMPRLFEANVRAYQGEIEVNREIARSVQTPSEGVDFWWLNNGVTIVAEQVFLQKNCLVIENPLIVNGLQTSQEIYNAGGPSDGDERMILVRVLTVTETDQQKRDAIIRATNRQTNVQHASFRATEEIHYDLEIYLKDQGFYYDRRKNYYKREKKPADKIIGINRLAQAVLAVLEQRPDTARARPTAVFKERDDYEKVFSSNKETHPLEMYGVIVHLLKVVEKHFKNIKDADNQIHRNNLKYHVLMILSWIINGGTTLPAKGIAKLKPKAFKVDETSKQVEVATRWVFEKFNECNPIDSTAKDQGFTNRLKEDFEKSPPSF